VFIDKSISNDVGLVAVNFSFLEMYVTSFLWGLLSDDSEISQMITSQLSFRKLLDLLDNLFRHKVKDVKCIQKMETLITAARKAEEDRNKIMHSMWMSKDPSGNELQRIKFSFKSGKAKVNKDDILIADGIKNIANEIGNTAVGFSTFLVQLANEKIVRLDISPLVK
jgi:hypothetical protein